MLFDMESLSILGAGPFALRTVSSLAEVQDAVRQARETKSALYPIGGANYLHLGGVPTKPGVALKLTGLDQVIDYPARDLTITIQTGMTLGKLAEILAVEGQELPVDGPASATLGGMLATNSSGPRRMTRGTLRDYLLGIQFVSDEGKVIQGGGRVVKNVAGYDLMKLHIGALGTLGILTQATFKVIPKAEERAFLAFGLNAATLGPTLDRLHTSHARPAMLEVLNARAAKALGVPLPTGDAWVVMAGFEEKRVTVAQQLLKLKEELTSAPVREITTIPGDSLLAALTKHLQDGSESFTLNATMLPSQVASYLQTATSVHPEVQVHAHAAVGVVQIEMPCDMTVENAANIVTKLKPNGAGSVVIQRCPPMWKAVLPKTAMLPVAAEVMATIKQTLDPDQIFNPGR
jgi:glycolate oxidase FAD binding subunit